MAPDAVTAERAYRSLKADFLRGRLAPGASINVQALAAELHLSISPVRDALHRLIGERIVAVRSGGGFQVPEMDVAVARGLYVWHRQLVLAARGTIVARAEIDRAVDAVAAIDEADAIAMADTTFDLFVMLGDGTDLVEHARAIRSAGERLHGLRLRETRLPGRKTELTAILGRLRDGNPIALRRALIAYHVRRMAHLPMLVERLYSPAPARGR